MRTRTLLLLATVVTVVPVWLAGFAEGGGASPHPSRAPVAQGPPSPAARALALLRDWDRRRARAWATGDPAALTPLYVPASRTGARDRLDLRRWADRGLRVIGLHQQVRSLRIVARTPGRLVVVVTDRTVGGVAVGAARRTAVPSSGWATQRIILRRFGGGWRVGEAQPAR